MLELKNLNVKYTKEILRNVNLKFINNHIYGIIGESGVGKTTLLKALLGNIEENVLVFNNQNINFKNRENYIKNNVFYVDQFSTFFQNMTIKQHFEFYSSMKQKNMNVKEIHEILRTVHLERVNINKSPIKLSLGERKRFLIALAIYSEKEILIFDEPTASLDQNNISLIKDILGKIRDRTIILSSHDLEFCEICDSIYKIENCNVIPIKNNIHSNEKIVEHGTYSFHPIQYLKYKNIFQVIKQILIIILGFIICFQSCVGIKMINGFYQEANKYKYILNENMLYLRNRHGPVSDWSYSGDAYTDSKPLSTEDKSAILNIQGVESIKPYMHLYNTDFSTTEKTVISRNNKIVNEFNDSSDSRGICIVPYFKDNGIDDNCKKVAISNSLAKHGNIQTNDEITISVYLPTKQYIYNDENQYKFISYKLVEMKFLVDKILNDNEGLYNPKSSDNVYIPHELFIQYINQYSNEEGERIPHDSSLISEPFQCDDYIILCDTDKLIDVYKEISEEYLNLDVFSNAIYYMHSFEQAKEIQSRQILITTVLSLSGCIVYFFVVYFQLSSRRKERNLLLDHGVAYNEIRNVLRLETIIRNTIVWILSSVVLFSVVEQYDVILISLILIVVLIFIEELNIYIFLKTDNLK